MQKNYSWQIIFLGICIVVGSFIIGIALDGVNSAVGSIRSGLDSIHYQLQQIVEILSELE